MDNLWIIYGESMVNQWFTALWYTYTHLKKLEFVNWDFLKFPIQMDTNKTCSSHHQPDGDWGDTVHGNTISSFRRVKPK